MWTRGKLPNIVISFFRYFRPFIPHCGISWYYFLLSHVELGRACTRARTLLQSSMQGSDIPIHFAGILMPGGENVAERNPIISLAGCHVGAVVTRQVFSFITYESGRPSFEPTVGSNRISQTRRCGNRIHDDPVWKPEVCSLFGPREEVFFPIHLGEESPFRLTMQNLPTFRNNSPECTITHFSFSFLFLFTFFGYYECVLLVSLFSLLDVNHSFWPKCRKYKKAYDTKWIPVA